MNRDNFDYSIDNLRKAAKRLVRQIQSNYEKPDVEVEVKSYKLNGGFPLFLILVKAAFEALLTGKTVLKLRTRK